MYKLLVVDDEEINREVLQVGFADTYEIIQAKNGNEALDIIYSEDITAVLMDLNMPGRNGFEVLNHLNESGYIKILPVFIITSSNDNDELLRAYELGAVDVISKPYNIQFLRRVVSNTIELYSQRDQLARLVKEKTRELIRQNNRLVEAMADIVEFRSNESGAHVKRVSGYTKILMKGLVKKYPQFSYLAEDIESISFAACLHDLGKIAISDTILNKPGKLTSEEFEVMKTHTVHGHDQIKALQDIMDPKLYKYSLDIARHHHERYDGSGYPDHHEGEQLSIWSQAAGLADVYDALTSERCYKNAYDHETAVNMILNGECGKFNPCVTETFKALTDKFNNLRLGIAFKRIMVIDTSNQYLSMLKNILESDYTVTTFDDFQKAQEVFDSGNTRFDLIIIDMTYDSDKGFDLIQHVCDVSKSTIPFIICASNFNMKIITKASGMGVKAFFRNPVNSEIIHKKIATILGE